MTPPSSFSPGSHGVSGRATERSADLVVLGAGPAGLAAAWRAALRGLSVVVLEKSDQVGGLAGSFEVDGIRVDYGSHRLNPATDPAILDDLRGLLGDDLQTRLRSDRLRIGGSWVRYPLRGREVASALPPAMVRRAARDAVFAPVRRSDDSYAGVLRARVGPTLYDAVYGPWALKQWGLDGDAIAAEQARRRASVDRPWRFAAQLVGRRRRGGAPETFLYPRRGFGQLSDALADAAVAAGASMLTGAEVTRVHARTDGVRVEWDSGGLHATQAFSTMPITTLGRVARPAPSVQAVQGAAGLFFRAMVLVYLVHEGGRWSQFDAHYLPDAPTPVTRVSEPTNYRSSADDPSDRSVVCAELPCRTGDATWAADDATLASMVQEGLTAAGLPPVRLPSSGGVVVRRLPRFYPVYRQGYLERLAGIESWADRLAHVASFGRLGLFVHHNSHQAMRVAYDAVDCLGPDGVLDHVCWAAARDGRTALSPSD
ncbi:MAG TPA: FAD-dependent oxidoreductase [Actinomycetales bacterium]|nr:FAD-dependent oxidoreductase [Actinomycetales bacterium]